MWLTKTVAKLVVLMVVAVGLLGASSANAIPARPAFPLAPTQSGDFAVDSFFDITYEIDFEGAPGGILEGMDGKTQGTAIMEINPGCVVPDNGLGTADLPPLGCEYISLDLWQIINDLPLGNTIDISTILMDFINVSEFIDIDGSGQQTYDATLHLPMEGTGPDLAGFSRTIDMPVAVETYSAPRTPGDPVQTFDREMVSLQGSIFGDPDFEQLDITLGTAHGLAGPGETTLSLQAGEFGDAPEGDNAVAYPALGITGAFPTCQAIGPASWIQHDNYGAWFGPNIDFEPDGNAGQCLNPPCFPPYDQDECFMDGDAGLIMPEPYTIDLAVNVVPCPAAGGTPLGQTCNAAVWGTDIDIRVHNSMPSDTIGYVNVLIDWNQDGQWGGASTCPGGGSVPEHVLVNQPVPNPYDGLLSGILGAGSNFLIGPNDGYAWTRFTITERPVTLPWFGDGVFEDGETEDYLLHIIAADEIDHKMHFPQYPDPNGWDINATIPNIVADDFLCTDTAPITNVIFWGSWNDDFIGQILNVHLSFHDDDRSGTFSKPVNPPLWEWDTNVFTVTPVDPPSLQGWGDPNQGAWEPDNHQQYFRFDVPIPDDIAFIQQEGTIYWMDLQFVTEGGQFGVKTSLDHFEDDAVFGIYDPGGPYPGWQELIDPITGESLDLAFVIQGPDGPEEMDYGDAPDPSYPTLRANDGARHVYDPAGPFMGSQPDLELDGQPNAGATGDDNDGNDDEDGVTFSVLVAGDPAADIDIDLTLSPQDCVMNAWIDFDGNGIWGSSEQILSDVTMLKGAIRTASFPIPVTAKITTDTFARVRCNSTGGLIPTGLAEDGEVEDYKVTIDGYDYGDAPDPPYSTLHATTPSGAAHKIDPAFGDFYLGTLIDAEWDGQPNANATGDDIATSDDEDGITFLGPLVPGTQTCIQIDVFNTSGYNPYLAAWIDFNGNGTWETIEHLFDPIGGASEPLPASSSIKCFDVPVGAKSGPTYGRFRLDPGVVNPTPYNPWFLGEVEDYQVYIEATKWIQPPEPEGQCFYGWDEFSVYGSPPPEDPHGFPPHIAADDWPCNDDRPITDIHWWGSYIGWNEELPPDPPNTPDSFHIGVWTDIPESNSEGFSHPGMMIHEWRVPLTDLNEQWVGCDFHPEFGQDTCFMYHYQIPTEEEWFYQNPGEDAVYWLSISAIYLQPEAVQIPWGWKTRPHFWNDAAVRIFDPTAPVGVVPYIFGEPILLSEVEPWDMAFVLTTQPGPPEAPDVDIAIVATDDAELSWPHVEYDIYGNAVNVTKYLIYRKTTPYFSAPGNLAKTLTGFTPSGTIAWVDPDKIGDPTDNYYYYVVAVTQDINGNDIPSENSNHVGEFDFALVPGVAP